MDDDLANEVRSSLRELIGASEGGISADELEEFGWNDLYADDPRLAVSVLFDEIGRLSAATAAFDLLAALVAADGLPAATSPAVLLLDSSEHGTVADGTEGSLVEVSGHILSSSASITHFIVAQAEGGVGARAFVLSAAGATIDPVDGIDGRAGVRRVTGSLAVVGAPLGSDDARSLVDSLRRAASYEQLGLARQMLAVAIDHVSSRRQFGQPIGTYQAVQHRLADVHVAIEAASFALESTWSEPSSLGVAVAYSLSFSAADIAIRQSLQVCGGMAFTEEFALAPLVRRSLMLSGLLESAARVTLEIAGVVMGSRTIPRLSSFADQRL